ncbi:hypothetical protein Y1Q_0006395 [Alligator mississippiensis]|uniref:Cytochrome b5 heme-binding domain-containing protein n=1 Tax=Alligator mississippiensis TaxID=8496 RepID=A0A151NXX1_ALLMI|nr:hypothetical protein Y1Q_0006395 [Alligator mississippiensis]
MGKGHPQQERWLVINRKVYDISQFHRQHPGGSRVISHYAGQDATDAFVAFHLDKALVRKYMTPLLIGELAPDQPRIEPHKNVQNGFLQHDLGHLSVFSKPKWNHLGSHFVMGFLQGGSASWWKHLHNQHHAKPNCFHKDPDLNMHPLLFALGKKLSVELGRKKKKYMPYNHQHKYYFITMPPFLIPVYVAFHTVFKAIQRKQCVDLAFSLSFVIRFILMYKPLLGVMGLLMFHELVRVLQSTWFTWVSQMNHIPMNIDYDKNMDWFTTQLQGTCNVHPSPFNDWFTGHLNFQIEHHLFPTMPRHNYWKVAPLVKSLCTKHGIEYQCKSLITAFADIVRSLKESGELWLDAYLHK